MKKMTKQILIVLPSSLLLTTVIFLLCYFTSWFRDYLWGVVMVCVWTFFIFPSYIECVLWINRHLDFYRAFWLGYFLQLMTYLLPILLAPVCGVAWWVRLFCSAHETKSRGDDIFQL